MAENLKQMRNNFENAVAAYVTAFSNRFNLNQEDCWWVGDRVGTDVFCFGDIYAISLEDMIYCVEENVTYDEFVENTEYCIKCKEFNLPLINLKSWHMGAPRIPQSTFDRLDGLKKDLNDAIKETKDFL